MFTDHDIAVMGAVCGVAALAAAICGGWMLFADQDHHNRRLRQLEEWKAEQLAEDRAARRVPAWDEE